MCLDTGSGCTKYGNRTRCMSKKRRLSRSSRPSLEKKDVLRQAYYKYAKEDGHHPESYRVFKTLYERHIEGKHVTFQRYIIPPKNEKRLKTTKPSYSLTRAIVQDARR